MEGKVVCIPGLEDRWVRLLDCFSEWHEANPLEDHVPHASLHDALLAQEDCWVSARWSMKYQAAFMAVEVVGKL